MKKENRNDTKAKTRLEEKKVVKTRGDNETGPSNAPKQREGRKNKVEVR